MTWRNGEREKAVFLLSYMDISQLISLVLWDGLSFDRDNQEERTRAVGNRKSDGWDRSLTYIVRCTLLYSVLIRSQLKYIGSFVFHILVTMNKPDAWEKWYLKRK